MLKNERVTIQYETSIFYLSMNTTKKNFPEETIHKVWEKAATVEGQDPDKLRKDYHGALIIKAHYCNRDSEYGWEIFEDQTGTKSVNDASALYPLQWENKLFRETGDFRSIVTSLLATNLKLRQE